VSEHLPVSRPINLKGHAAIVTGSARGIGRAIAIALAREGADVTVADVLPTDEAVAEILAYRRRGPELIKVSFSYIGPDGFPKRRPRQPA